MLSGGERARLCLAGLLLSDYNVLILDEPGNHLDVDTVDALAEALLEYQGTVIFTSHDRHFTKRVATCIVEVRDGRVTNYSGQYDAYVYKVNKEIEAGERELASERDETSAGGGSSQPRPRHVRRNGTNGDARKEIKTLERTIAQLDEQKRALNAQLLQSTDAAEALRLHNEVSAADRAARRGRRTLVPVAGRDRRSGLTGTYRFRRIFPTVVSFPFASQRIGAVGATAATGAAG